MKSLDVFLPRMLPAVVGCPSTLAKQSLVDAAIEFCEETMVVQATVEPQSTQRGIGVYDLDVPSQQRVVSTLKVWYGTRLLFPAPASQVDTPLAYVTSVGGENVPRGEPSTFYEYAPGTIGIFPAPDSDSPLPVSARVALKPTRDATAVDDLLYDDWQEYVIAGAQARVLAIPGQPFTGDPSLAYSKFRFGVNRASNLQLRGRVRSSMAVKPRPFF